MAHDGFQLSLPLATEDEPTVADATEPATTMRPITSRLPGEVSVVELLVTLLGPASTEPCRRIFGTYPTLRETALVNPAVFADHGLTRGAIARLEAVLELAKRY